MISLELPILLVDLIADDDDFNLFVGMVLDLIQPFVEVFEAVSLGDVVHQERSNRPVLEKLSPFVV